MPFGQKLVKHGWDLNVKQQVLDFEDSDNKNGKILFYRRLKDEIISPGGPQRPDLNRINFLVLEFLKKKYELSSVEDENLSLVREKLLSGGRLSRDSLQKSKNLEGTEKMVFEFFEKYFIDLNQGHNEPMPNDSFRLP